MIQKSGHFDYDENLVGFCRLIPTGEAIEMGTFPPCIVFGYFEVVIEIIRGL